MRSNGLATFLLMIPVLTVPALAIFGVPQFAPVVASPLDEGRDHDRESRVGNSARQTPGELFDDVEGFGTDSELKSGPASDHRENRAGSLAGQKRGTKPFSGAGSRWGDDLDADSDESSQPRRRSASTDSAELIEQGFRNEQGPRKSSKSAEGSSRPGRTPSHPPTGDGATLNSTSEVDQGVNQVGFAEDGNLQKLRPASNVPRSKINDPRNSKRRDSSSTPLTWQAAVDRLNEFDIHSFRLEPGHQLGQFVFICSYTPPETPRVSYRFEAGADEPLQAVEKVLEQIVDWQQRQ